MAPETKPSLSARISALLRFLERILDSFWAFATLTFSKCLAPFHKLIDFIAPKHHTEKKGTGSPKEPPIISKVVPTPPPDNQSENCRYRNDPWWKTTAEMLGIAAVIAYTIFSGFQMHYAHQQAIAATTAADAATQSLNTLKEQFRLDQRPYIVIPNILMIDLKTGKPSPAIKGKPLAVNVHIKNVGKSLALHINIHRHLLIGESDIVNIRTEPVDIAQGSEAIAQSQETTTTAVSVRDTFANESVDVPPSELVNWDGTNPIIVFGRITYQDASGYTYCTPFMNRYLGGPDVWGIVNQLSAKHPRFILKLTDLCPSGKAF